MIKLKSRLSGDRLMIGFMSVPTPEELLGVCDLVHKFPNCFIETDSSYVGGAISKAIHALAAGQTCRVVPTTSSRDFESVGDVETYISSRLEE